ncbi:unnamed protein product [Hyaloperonospora brassicae]|uniref:Uncharacterized protein n=1 Tax=Hyaloperonospora brassicae TaxID=162125 RepID=A0AAV0T1D4_HYABA|nr:unnamed protein product [Hyaloperonospora brassicae]
MVPNRLVTLAARQSLDDSATAALRGLLSLSPGGDSAAERESASLSLVVNFRHVAPSCVLQALQDVAAVEHYSHSLQRYPLVKQAFWEQVLASKLMLTDSKTGRQQLQLQHERFPSLVLDFSRCVLTTELLEILTTFFAQQQETQPKSERSSGVEVVRDAVSLGRLVPVTLKLVRCRLTAEKIAMLTPILVPDRRTRDFPVTLWVTSLDLSEHSMRSDELIALAELLDNCRRRRERRRELSLEELVLENALSRALTPENWEAFQAFVRAAFGVTEGCRPSLKRLSLARNSLSCHHIGCICSALRCDSTGLEDLSLANTLSLVDPVDRKVCWQWLAIGLRPMSFRRRRPGLRRLDLSSNPLYLMDGEAWIEGLRDHQATVWQWLEDAGCSHTLPGQSAAVRCLLSSSAELYSSPIETCPRLRAVEQQVNAVSPGVKAAEYEVLASVVGDRAWLCVVLPGFGVAWTQTEHAMSWEPTEDGQQSGSAVLSELVMNDMAVSRTTADALKSFVGGFRAQLRSLELRRNALSAMDLDAILAGNQQLSTLDVEGCRFLQLQLLVDALRGIPGQHLRKLNLNANLIGADAMNALSAALRGQGADCLPVLQELRVAHNEIGATGVRHLHAALEANKVLMLLELDVPHDAAEAPRWRDDDEYTRLYRTRCMGLNASFDNELVGVTPLPLARKIAFLLVLHAHAVVLDRGICAVVFRFAAEEKRRRILWHAVPAR